MSMIKLLKARFKNFYKFTDFVCEFGERVTHLVGINGSGKSTVAYKGLLACLNGISEQRGGLIGKRFLFIGKGGKSADIEYTFKDQDNGSEFTIKRHVTPSGQDLKFQSTSGDQIDDSWLRSFLNVSLMSAKNFCDLSGREQSIALGIDTTPFESQLKKLKDEYTILNRELKNMGEITPVEPAEMVNMAELIERKEKMRALLNTKYLANKKANQTMRDEYNKKCKEREEKIRQIEQSNDDLQGNISEADECRIVLSRLGFDCTALISWIEAMPQPQNTESIKEIPEPEYINEMPDDSELQLIDSEILRASETNAKAGAYIEYKKNVELKEAKKKELADNKAKQESAVSEAIAYIKQFKFPFAGLSVDEDGGLVLDGRPLNEAYFSRGELEIIVAQLHASLNPDFRTRFIDDFDLIDDENQEKILKVLDEKGFQVITAEVRKTKDRENTLILRECAIATDEDERPTLL
jgi:hypothetical protein